MTQVSWGIIWKDHNLTEWDRQGLVDGFDDNNYKGEDLTGDLHSEICEI